MRACKKRLLGFLFFFATSVYSTYSAAEKQIVVFIKPVANLIALEPSKYERLDYFLNSYSPEVGPTCPRTFQALFGEMAFVEDPQLHDNYVRVELCNCFFASKLEGIKPLYYWAKRTDFIFWEELNLDERALFPPPIFYKKPASVMAPGVVTLAKPWACNQNGQVYSAGTRFVVVDSDTTQKTVTIQLFDADTGKKITEIISAKLLVNRGRPVSGENKRTAFVNLLKKWCKNHRGVIPYVWGGASYVSRVSDENFGLIEDFVKDKNASYWMRENSKPAPDGFDCSGLVLRAAQACGIAYFCRTAGTAGSTLVPLANYLQSVEPGDLFVTEGHNHIVVAAGSDMIIEAAGYSSGYACVQLISVARRFENAKNYLDLIALFRAHLVPIYRCKDGRGVTPTGFVIVKLPV